MKNFSLILNLVLLVAVIMLYVNHCSSSKKENTPTTNNTTATDNTASGLIAYVNIDSVFKKYTLFAELDTLLASKQRNAQVQMANRATSAQRKYADYQDKISKGLMTSRQVEAAQLEMSQEQEKLAQMEEQFTKDLANAQAEMNRTLYDSIHSFLKEYNKTAGYKMIIQNSFGGTLLYGHESLDITTSVVEGLNKRYAGAAKNTN